MDDLKLQPPVGAQEFLNLCARSGTTALTFDDVLLEPQYSEIESRKEVDLSTYITPLRKLDIPIVAANMDTICESKMAIAMGKLGGLGVIHRYMPLEKQLEEVRVTRAALLDKPVAAAIGVKNGIVEHTKALVKAGADIIVIDVAHGWHKLVGDALDALTSLELESDIGGLPVEFIAGNVAIPHGATYLMDHKAAGIKVGVGSGSICSTRLVTGHGVPQLLAVATSVLRAKTYMNGEEFSPRTIIADGGIRKSADIVKALAAGANTVMVGALLAGCEETPGRVTSGFVSIPNMKEYRGMASREAQTEFYGNSPDAPEGVTTMVPARGSVKDVIANLVGGIRSGLSYSGARNIQELQLTASWLRVSENGYLESLTSLERKL